MSAITKERIELFIKNPLENGLTRGEQMELARIALASLEAKAIAVRTRWKDEGSGHGDWKYYNIAHRDALMADDTRECELVYTAQPAPVAVPDEMTPEMMRAVQLNSELGAYAASNLSGAYDMFSEFWKVACRAAMLHGSEPEPEPETDNTNQQFESLSRGDK